MIQHVYLVLPSRRATFMFCSPPIRTHYCRFDKFGHEMVVPSNADLRARALFYSCGGVLRSFAGLRWRATRPAWMPLRFLRSRARLFEGSGPRWGAAPNKAHVRAHACVGSRSTIGAVSCIRVYLPTAPQTREVHVSALCDNGWPKCRPRGRADRRFGEGCWIGLARGRAPAESDTLDCISRNNASMSLLAALRKTGCKKAGAHMLASTTSGSRLRFRIERQGKTKTTAIGDSGTKWCVGEGLWARVQ